ncbi:cyclin D3, plant [Fistulifera solaris]|uniref:Cyclin D3, plant n=1 Tax=Fistulifera solaris TaxID=1519565 RepID=A0A1Z5KDW2_FISSO|nr:cyclin D3, plant [Fistulifera solaris]|eukprot:GAX24366.1 cyclin D3, plant [Fistulifera solaris]
MMEASKAVTPLKSEEGMIVFSASETGGEDCSGSVEAADHLKVLLKQEVGTYSPCVDYLNMVRQLPGIGSGDFVSEGWRRKLCEWSYEVVDHFGFDREAVSIALNYLDRYVATKVQDSNHVIGQKDFQLLAVTCLYMALKIHGETEDPNGQRRKLRIDAFVELSRGFFRVEIIEEMERDIFTTLDWRVNPPTCLRFVSSILHLCPKWTIGGISIAHSNFIGSIFDVSRYLTELSVCVASFSCTFKTSVIAYASVLCAIEALESTRPLPYAVRVAFQNNVADATGLTPICPDILHAKAMVKELCPDMFNKLDAFDDMPEVPHEIPDFESPSESAQQNGGKTSPICVMDDVNESRRKRIRSSQNS